MLAAQVTRVRPFESLPYLLALQIQPWPPFLLWSSQKSDLRGLCLRLEGTGKCGFSQQISLLWAELGCGESLSSDAVIPHAQA